jgi:ribosomal RNA-processing protein 9
LYEDATDRFNPLEVG